MLGTVGFSIAAVTFMLYAASTLKLTDKKTTFSQPSYAGAFGLTAVACVVWAMATQSSPSSLETYVLVGDAFLLGASLLLARIMLGNKSPVYMAVAVAGAITAFIYRLGVTYQNPVMREDVLVFYTPRVFGALLAFVVLTVWLPVNMRFYEQVVVRRLNADLLRQVYFSCNLASIIGLTGVMFARKAITISVAFSLIVVGYLTMALLNLAVVNQAKKGVVHGK